MSGATVVMGMEASQTLLHWAVTTGVAPAERDIFIDFKYMSSNFLGKNTQMYLYLLRRLSTSDGFCHGSCCHAICCFGISVTERQWKQPIRTSLSTFCYIKFSVMSWVDDKAAAHFLTTVCKQFMLRWNAWMCIGFYLLKTAFSCFASTLSVMLSLALPVATLSVMMLVLSSSSSLSDPLELLSDATSGAFLAPHTLHTHADEPLTATHIYWLTHVNGPFQERTNNNQKYHKYAKK